MKLTITLTAALFSLASPALAAPHEGSAFIHDYDADHDGQVSRGRI
jgi:hypothetical protein